jgi:hypothetical protein
MSALSKVEMSVSAPFLEAVISMGMVVMTKRELNRIDIQTRLDAGRLTPAAAADLNAPYLRQTHRPLKRFRRASWLR